MKLGIFGGSFDPVHRGHVLPVLGAIDELGLDRVLVFPTGRPPHKPDRRFAPPAVRFAMAELAFLDRVDVVVSPFELDATGPSYTIDTVRKVAAENPDAELYLLVGGDSVATFDRWRDWRAILDHVTLVALARPGSELGDPSTPLPGFLLDAGARVVRLESVRVDVSSTGLRELLARGEEPSAGTVPDRVLDYLRKYDDYRRPPRMRGSSRSAGDSPPLSPTDPPMSPNSRPATAGSDPDPDSDTETSAAPTEPVVEDAPGTEEAEGASVDSPGASDATAEADETIVELTVAAAEDRKAERIRVLDLAPVSDFTDRFVLCSGTNERQVEAIADLILERTRAGGFRPLHVEGQGGGRWILLDFGGEMVVHVFLDETRDFYALERLWNDAKDLTEKFTTVPG